ncbi:iron chelate uptake ABC transporter family permease subunit [Brevibacillus humidisoli]|uniref:FecCD family ABC transporter permease n=1 Tax=Brevibacillus humidisoli TaxID=2895522 RepID=UPI001E5043B3|nr:iron chelate uptake ABC transporter family permease subunit [Brevibacillus humidisoli]UFJ40243.1 iron chelate uptake ABC transporter family permease subunit [Brevibacillus humidisoli]
MYTTSSISKVRKKATGELKDRTVRLSLFPLLLFCSLLLAAVMIAATAAGAVAIPYLSTAKIILSQLPWINLSGWDQAHETIIMQIRLPRVLVAALVGAALGVSGAVMQGLFRNSMADPGIIGVSSGGSLGAVIAIYLGLAQLHYLLVPAFAFCGAAGTTFLVYLLATSRGRTPMATLLLAGIAVSSFLGATTSLVLSFSNENVMREILFWMMGGLSSRGWAHVTMIMLPVLLGMAILFCYARYLNILLLGEETAHTLGVKTQKTRKVLLAVTSLVTGAAVSVSGVIAFVGLVIPHIIRILIGPDHRLLLPVSAFGGAIFLIAADTFARLAIRPAELQVGIVTAFVGAPFFLYLLRKNKKTSFF